MIDNIETIKLIGIIVSPVASVLGSVIISLLVRYNKTVVSNQYEKLSYQVTTEVQARERECARQGQLVEKIYSSLDANNVAIATIAAEVRAQHENCIYKHRNNGVVK